ncbi:MAG TPA: MerR family transcriptional regulator [Bryobacteraceae bacterium]|nr:MerR family transcriptional regulator [Bryobacteraceae bacterium]
MTTPVFMTIGEVAKYAHVRASAIRFYEKAGLLPKPGRSGGQRRYDQNILPRLALLDWAKGCGFTLEEIRELFGKAGEAPLSQRMQKLCLKKIDELETLSQRIEFMRGLLERAQKCQCIDVQECGRRILNRRRS